jgi:hypothetical protein
MVSLLEWQGGVLHQFGLSHKGIYACWQREVFFAAISPLVASRIVFHLFVDWNLAISLPFRGQGRVLHTPHIALKGGWAYCCFGR